MANNNRRKNNNKAKDVKYTEVNEAPKPQLPTGNYVIEVKSNGETIKKIAVANAEVYISKLNDGGLTVDLK